MPRDPARGGPTDRERFQHMRDAARDALHYVRGRALTDLEHDSQLARALVNCLQVIGEAANRLTPAGQARTPAVPWRDIVRTRNILVHVYWGIDCGLIWGMVHEHLPPLLAEIERVLNIEDDAERPLPPTDGGS